jgi:hypothetical protein
LAIEDLRSGPNGETLFQANLGLDVDLRFVQQVWRNGFRIYSGETRARSRALAKLQCELKSRLEIPPDAVLPTAIVRARITAADVSYDHFEVVHTLGVGGDAAKILGETAQGLLKRFKPSLEEKLLAKANAAIIKSADTKELHVEFEKLLVGKNAITKKK